MAIDVDILFGMKYKTCILRSFFNKEHFNIQMLIYLFTIHSNIDKRIKDTKVKIVRNVQKAYTNSVSIRQRGPLKQEVGSGAMEE